MRHSLSLHHQDHLDARMRKYGGARTKSWRSEERLSSMAHVGAGEEGAVGWFLNFQRVRVAVMAEGFLWRSNFVEEGRGKETLVYSRVEEFIERERADMLEDRILTFALRCKEFDLACLLLRDRPSAKFISVLEKKDVMVVWGITLKESLQLCQMLEVSLVPTAADFDKGHVGKRRVAIGMLSRAFEEKKLFTHLNYTPPSMSAVAIALSQEEGEEEEKEEAVDSLRGSHSTFEPSIIEEVSLFGEEGGGWNRWSTIVCCGLSSGETLLLQVCRSGEGFATDQQLQAQVRKCFRRVLNLSRTGVVLPGGGSTILALGNLLQGEDSERVIMLRITEL